MSFSFGPLLFLKHFDKAADLGLQDHRHQRLDQEVHGPQGIAFFHLREETEILGGQKNDRRVPRRILPPNQLRCFKAIQARHENIQQDHRKLVAALHKEKRLCSPECASTRFWSRSSRMAWRASKLAGLSSTRRILTFGKGSDSRLDAKGVLFRHVLPCFEGHCHRMRAH